MDDNSHSLPRHHGHPSNEDIAQTASVDTRVSHAPADPVPLTKKPYSAPRLVCYGKLTAVTRQFQASPVSDKGSNGMAVTPS